MYAAQVPRSPTCALLLILVADVARAGDDVGAPDSVPHGRPLPRRPAGDAAAGLEYTHVGDATATGGASATYAFGQHAVLLPKDGFLVHMQDTVLGGAGGGGFAYQLDTLVGPGRWLGAGGLGLAGGVGVDGITGGRIPIGMRLPIRAWSSVNVGPGVRLEVSGEVAWIAWTAARRGRGARLADELVGRFGIYIGGRGRDAGCFVGFTARQALGTTLITLGLGVGLAAAAID
jgi:hypothetical protein